MSTDPSQVRRREDPASAISRVPEDGGLSRQVSSPEEEEEKKVHRKAVSGDTAGVGLALQSDGAGGSDASPGEKTEAGVRSLQGRGQPLPILVREFMEPRMGYDLSPVRVHTDTQSADLARSVNALAFATGSDIVFGASQYRPDSDEGKTLLAHELTHVVQQTGAGGPFKGKGQAGK
jgi:hypothetical protein